MKTLIRGCCEYCGKGYAIKHDSNMDFVCPYCKRVSHNWSVSDNDMAPQVLIVKGV